jgi:hypothetical protein
VTVTGNTKRHDAVTSTVPSINLLKYSFKLHTSNQFIPQKISKIHEKELYTLTQKQEGQLTKILPLSIGALYTSETSLALLAVASVGALSSGGAVL